VTLCCLVVCGLTACGGFGQPKTEGHATLWVTRDRGARVLLVRDVPAGLTALQALEREADVETRYGGRYVQAINGVEGRISSRRDWFYFVNGIEADRSAADVRLHPGDVEWWDYRSWAQQMRVPVVVGAFPEPFLHADDPSWVVAQPRFRVLARRLAKLIGGGALEQAPDDGNVLDVVSGRLFRAQLGGGGEVHARIGATTARRLLRDPAAVRFRYEVP
jgi:hypothetical protein